MESTDRICHRRLGDRRGAQTQNGSVKGIATLSRRPFGANVWSRADMALSVVGGMLRGANQKFLGGHARSRANFQSFRNSFRKGQQSFFQTVDVSFQSLTPMQER